MFHKTFFADPFFSLSLFLCLFLLPFLRRANNNNNNNNNNSLFQRGDGNDKLGGDVETGRWEETQPKSDCRRTGESIIIILASFFLSRGKNTRRLYYYHRSFVFTRGGGQKSRSSRSM